MNLKRKMEMEGKANTVKFVSIFFYVLSGKNERISVLKWRRSNPQKRMINFPLKYIKFGE